MDLNKSIQKAKRKNLVRIAGISILITLVSLGLLIVALDKIATNNYRKLDKALFNYQTIAAPNTQIDSQVIANSSFLGGDVVTNQSKNIDGYIVPWSSLRSKYTTWRNSIDYNELTNSWYHSDQNSYEYNRQTKQKVATFYHPSIKKYYDNVKNELPELKKWIIMLPKWPFPLIDRTLTVKCKKCCQKTSMLCGFTYFRKRGMNVLGLPAS